VDSSIATVDDYIHAYIRVGFVVFMNSLIRSEYKTRQETQIPI
jgi:hypothetical protein